MHTLIQTTCRYYTIAYAMTPPPQKKIAQQIFYRRIQFRNFTTSVAVKMHSDKCNAAKCKMIQNLLCHVEQILPLSKALYSELELFCSGLVEVDNSTVVVIDWDGLLALYLTMKSYDAPYTIGNAWHLNNEELRCTVNDR